MQIEKNPLTAVLTSRWPSLSTRVHCCVTQVGNKACSTPWLYTCLGRCAELNRSCRAGGRCVLTADGGGLQNAQCEPAQRRLVIEKKTLPYARFIAARQGTRKTIWLGIFSWMRALCPCGWWCGRCSLLSNFVLTFSLPCRDFNFLTSSWKVFRGEARGLPAQCCCTDNRFGHGQVRRNPTGLLHESTRCKMWQPWKYRYVTFPRRGMWGV